MLPLRKLTFVTCMLFVTITSGSVSAGAQNTPKPRFELNRDCFGRTGLLAAFRPRDIETKAILDNLPDPRKKPVVLLRPEGIGTSTIRDVGKNREWQVRTEVFEASRRVGTSDVDRFFVGLGDGELFINRGKVFAPDAEVWIERSRFGKHYEVAAQLRSSSEVYFVDRLGGPTQLSTQLARAIESRAYLQKKLSALTVENSVLVNCLPRNETELQILAYSTGRVQDWRAKAKEIDSLGFQQIRPRPNGKYRKKLEAAVIEGKDILIWAHSEDGVSLAIPFVDAQGKPEVMWIDANELVYFLRTAASKSSGLLVFNCCRSVETPGSIVAQIAGEGVLPLIAPRDKYVTANVEFLRGVASGKPGLKNMAGILTALALVPLTQDDDDQEDDDGNSP